MAWRFAANVVLLAHFAFLLFVILGGLAVIRRPRVAWLHLPAAGWGVLIELSGWVCPLTWAENTLRLRAGEAGYPGGFIEYYLLPVIYPPGLTRGVQFVLAAAVILVNVAVYAFVLKSARNPSMNGRR